MSIYERLENELRLSDLINRDSLANLAERFAAFHGAELLVTDLDGALLHGKRNGERYCDPAAPPICAACGFDVARFEADRSKFATLACPSGVRYYRARVDNQFDPAGYIVFGPFVESGQGVPPGVAVASAEDVHRTVELLTTVVQEIVFANFQSYLVQKLYLQATGEKGAGAADGGEEESVLESGELSGLF